MNVQGIGHRGAPGHHPQGHDGVRGAEEMKPAGIRESADAVPERDGATGRARGVIRLLQEGHFKGVADVRLRINFLDELQAAGTARAARTLQAGVDDLVSRLGDASEGPLAALLTDGVLAKEDIAGLAAGFEQEAGEILARFHAGESGLDETLTALGHALLALAEPPADPSGEVPETIPEIAAALEDEAEGPIENTQDLSTTITPAPDSGGDAATAESDAEGSLPAQDAYASLREALGSLMDDLRRRVAESRALPPLSPPQEHGKAHAKFLAIYTAMLDGSADAPTLPAEALDSRA